MLMLKMYHFAALVNLRLSLAVLSVHVEQTARRCSSRCTSLVNLNEDNLLLSLLYRRSTAMSVDHQALKEIREKTKGGTNSGTNRWPPIAEVHVASRVNLTEDKQLLNR